jgi:hypothetical protein
VPAGLGLRAVPGQVTKGSGWHWDSRGWVEIDGNGAVFSGYSVTGANIDVTASNVTISNVRVSVSGETWAIGLRHTSNVTIEDSELFSPNTGSARLMEGIVDVYSDSQGLTIQRNDIWHVDTGVQLEQGLVRNNYIHDLAYKDGDHINGITSNGGHSGKLTIDHNTIFNRFQQTDAVGLFQDFGAQTHRVITNNLLAGGGYTIYAGANPGKAATATDITVTNNRISRIYYPTGGYYGPATAYTPSGGNTWTGNTWDDTGAAASY